MPRASNIWFLLIAGAVLCGVSFFLDGATIAWVHAHSVPFFRHAAQFFTRWGDFIPIVCYIGVFLAIARLCRSKEWGPILGMMLACASASGLSAVLLRAITGRTRPSARVPAGWYGPRTGNAWIFMHYQYCAFPSAHTAVAIGAVVPLFLFARWGYAAVGLLLALAIAASRVYINAHHLSDVMAGAFLGLAVSLAVTSRISILTSGPRPLASTLPPNRISGRI